MVCDDVCIFYALTSYLVIDFILVQRCGRNSISTPFPQNHWTLGKASSRRVGLGTRTVPPRGWALPQAYQSSRSLWMMLLGIWVNLRWFCEEQGVGVDDPLESLSV